MKINGLKNDCGWKEGNGGESEREELKAERKMS